MQPEGDQPAPGFANVKPAPDILKEYPGNKGSVDPKTDGGGMGGNNLRDVERSIGIK